MTSTLINSIRKHGVRHTLKKVIFQGYWWACKLRRPASVSTIYGPRMTSQFDDRTFVFSAQGAYGFVLSDFLHGLRQPFFFLDIGANQGLYSLIAAANPKCKKAIAFEPVRRSHGLLQDNIRLNKFGNVVPVNAAVSDRDGSLEISVEPGHSGTASLNHRLARGVTQSISCMSAESISRLLENELAGVRANPSQAPLIIVKIDTEGHEPTVLEQLKRTSVWPRVGVIFFEVDERWFSGAGVIAALEEHGFKVAYRSPNAREHYDVMMRRDPRFL